MSTAEDVANEAFVRMLEHEVEEGHAEEYPSAEDTERDYHAFYAHPGLRNARSYRHAWDRRKFQK